MSELTLDTARLPNAKPLSVHPVGGYLVIRSEILRARENTRAAKPLDQSKAGSRACAVQRADESRLRRRMAGARCYCSEVLNVKRRATVLGFLFSVATQYMDVKVARPRSASERREQCRGWLFRVRSAMEKPL
jgi:hypothetical protein